MFLLCVAGLPLSTIHAQKKEIIDDEAPNGIVIVTIDKAGDEIIRIMNESQLPYIHDPKAPRFLLMDKQGKFALGIGGYARATGEYDFGGIVDDIDFVPANIPSNSKIKCMHCPCWTGMQVCNITFLQRYSFQALTACPAFILETVIPTTCQVPTATGNIS